METTTSCVTDIRNPGFERCYTEKDQTINSDCIFYFILFFCDCILMGTILTIHASLSTYTLLLTGCESAYNTKTYKNN